MGLADSIEYSLGGTISQDDPGLLAKSGTQPKRGLPTEVCSPSVVPHQQHQHHLGTCYKCKIPGSYLGVRNSGRGTQQSVF